MSIITFASYLAPSPQRAQTAIIVIYDYLIIIKYYETSMILFFLNYRSYDPCKKTSLVIISDYKGSL